MLFAIPLFGNECFNASVERADDSDLETGSQGRNEIPRRTRGYEVAEAEPNSSQLSTVQLYTFK